MNHKFKTIIALTTITTTALHIINRIQYSISTNKNMLSEEKIFFYEWRFGKIKYTKTGCGNPILLIHDLNVGSSDYEYKKIVQELAKTYEVYTLDLLGYGMSDKPNMTYTNFLYVQLTVDFIKNIIWKRTNIIASGDACSIAAMVTHNEPQLIDKLIFINPQSLYKCNEIPSKQTKLLKLLIETPVLGTFIFNLLTTKQRFENTFENEYFANTTKIEETDILTYLESSHRGGYCSKYSFASHTSLYMNTNIIHAVKEINNSILIIAGANKPDTETIVENYTYYNNAIEAVYVKNTKQLPHLESPEKVIEHIIPFL